MNEDQDKPDGYVIIHHRMTDTLYFGPFATYEEAFAWMNDVGDANRISRYLVPVYKTVDWKR